MNTKNDDAQHEVIPCTVKALPDSLKRDGMRTALAINPLNGINKQMVHTDDPNHPIASHLTVGVAKMWDASPRTLLVSFLDDASIELQDRIISHMNAWTKTCCIDFKRAEGTVGQVRISFGNSGYWSYLGTDILHIDENEPTMNLQGFSMDTPESEYKRVVRHETGHTLGFEHEHMRRELVKRIDPKLAYPYFLRNQGWSKTEVDQQVLTPLDQATIMGTPADETSIMCYQLPGSIMIDGKGIPGGTDINATDYAFAGSLYPQPHVAVGSTVPTDKMAAMATRGPKATQQAAAYHRYSPELIDTFNLATLQ